MSLLTNLSEYSGEPKFQQTTVTPELARKLLQRNFDNRTPSKRNIDRYAWDMVHGKWRMSTEPIRIDRDKNLIDGQHRLLAIIKAEELAAEQGKAFEGVTMFIVTGCDPEEKQVIDTGQARNLNDLLEINLKLPNAKDVSAFARNIAAIRLGCCSKGAVNNDPQLTNANLFKFIQDNQSVLVEQCNIAKEFHGKSKMIPLSAWAVLYFYFGESTNVKVHEYFNKCWSGLNIKDTEEPAAAFTRYMTSKRLERSSSFHAIEVFFPFVYLLQRHLKSESVVNVFDLMPLDKSNKKRNIQIQKKKEKLMGWFQKETVSNFDDLFEPYFIL